MSTSAARTVSMFVSSLSSVFSRVVSLRTELVSAEDQDGLVDLESQDLGLDEGERLSVNLDKTLAGLLNRCKYTVRLRVSIVGIACVPCSGRQLVTMLATIPCP
jgi:hypothetical protein